MIFFVLFVGIGIGVTIQKWLSVRGLSKAIRYHQKMAKDIDAYKRRLLQEEKKRP